MRFHYRLSPVLVSCAFVGIVAFCAQGAWAATPTYADVSGGGCATLTPCYTTIQAAVNNAWPAPAQVFVFPGT